VHIAGLHDHFKLGCVCRHISCRTIVTVAGLTSALLTARLGGDISLLSSLFEVLLQMGCAALADLGGVVETSPAWGASADA
jgi:hypothetical protein